MRTEAKIILSIVVLIIIISAIYYFGREKTPEVLTPIIPPVATDNTVTPITITEESINEPNFTGTKPKIMGTGELASISRTFVDQTVARFKKRADVDVPDIREEFGEDISSANYSIDINAKYIKGNTTESIVIDWYEYTGGANGNSLYRVYTTVIGEEKILPFSQIVKSDQQAAFLATLKKNLLTLRPAGMEGMTVFPESVNALKFSDLTNWSLDDKNLTIYFDKNTIGPGALGPVAFPLPLSVAKSYLVEKVLVKSTASTPSTITYTNASKDMIEVELPFPGAVTGKDFKVIGKARGNWFFEASFPIELRDKNGKLLMTAIAQAEGEWMTTNFVPFSADIKAPASYIGPATLVLKKDNASGLPEHDASISFPITVEY